MATIEPRQKLKKTWKIKAVIAVKMKLVIVTVSKMATIMLNKIMFVMMTLRVS